MVLSRLLRPSFTVMGTCVQVHQLPQMSRRGGVSVCAGNVRLGDAKRLCSDNTIMAAANTTPRGHYTPENTTNALRRTIPSFHSRRYFHATALREAAIRRRRRRGGQAPSPGYNDNKQQQQPDDDGDDEGSARRPIRRVMDPVVFGTRATALVNKIHTALIPLQAINDPFILTRDRDPEIGNGEYILLDVGPLFGQYTLQVDPEQALVHFQSPISGIMQYYCSTEDGEWRSMEDGHILEGLLVRDLIRQIKGVPKL